MGLADDLDYKYQPPNAFQRLMQAFAASRIGAWFFARTLARMDRVLGRLTHERVTVPSIMANLPVLVLTCTGRKSGLPRESHLIAVPFRGTLALLGTNFGAPTTPSWALNLEAGPHATVTHRGRSRKVLARPADDAERAQIMAESARYYSGYVKYQHRITGREVRIFVLEPAAPASG